MDDLIKAGGPAFPNHGPMGDVVWNGMTLRDYFAAKAMAAILHVNGTVYLNGNESKYARDAYAQADAMLAAREVK